VCIENSLGEKYNMALSDFQVSLFIGLWNLV